MTIEIEEKVADLLKKLRAQAGAHGMSLEAYLEQLVEPPSEVTSLVEFDRVLDELAALPTRGPSLPADFSRAEIYADHN